MKASYGGFEAKKSGGFIEYPPVGAYVAEIKNVRFVEGEGNSDYIEMMLDIIEGEYKNRYTEVYEDQKERFGDSVQYNGRFRLYPPKDGDDDWKKRAFEGNLWCVQESNPGYAWDWDEKKLKGKKVGINIREYKYKKEKDGVTEIKVITEIGKFETVDDVRNGKCKPLKTRIQKGLDESAATEEPKFTPVEKSDVPEVPW